MEDHDNEIAASLAYWAISFPLLSVIWDQCREGFLITPQDPKSGIIFFVLTSSWAGNTAKSSSVIIC